VFNMLIILYRVIKMKLGNYATFEVVIRVATHFADTDATKTQI